MLNYRTMDKLSRYDDDTYCALVAFVAVDHPTLPALPLRCSYLCCLRVDMLVDWLIVQAYFLFKDLYEIIV